MTGRPLKKMPGLSSLQRITKWKFSWFDGMSAHRSINLSSLRRKNAESSSNSGSSGCVKNEVISSKRKRKHVAKVAVVTSPLEHSPLLKVSGTTPTEEERETTDSSQSPGSIQTASGDSKFPALKCLTEEFYDVPCEQLARALLGKILIRKLDSGHILKGRVVETECYLGGEDRASHSFRGKMTERNAPMFMKPGTTYVYFTYGMYHCFNISSQGPGAAVLIRAVEPIEGVAVMASLRSRGTKSKKKKEEEEEKKKKKTKPPLKPHELCSGPSKLCIAFDIERDSCNKRDLATWPGLSLYADDGTGVGVVADVGDVVDATHRQSAVVAAVVATKRVGIESAGREWADKPLRFYLLGNPAVSKRDRAAEKQLAV